jgi:hypothetical protein
VYIGSGFTPAATDNANTFLVNFSATNVLKANLNTMTIYASTGTVSHDSLLLTVYPDDTSWTGGLRVENGGIYVKGGMILEGQKGSVYAQNRIVVGTTGYAPGMSGYSLYVGGLGRAYIGTSLTVAGTNVMTEIATKVSISGDTMSGSLFTTGRLVAGTASPSNSAQIYAQGDVYASDKVYAANAIWVRNKECVTCDGATMFLPGPTQTTGPFSIGVSGSNRALYLYSASAPAGTSLTLASDNRIAPVTSSLRFKHNIEYMGDDFANKIWNLKPATFQYKPKNDGYDVDLERRCGGFIVEDMHAAGLTEGVIYDAEGLPYSLEATAVLAASVRALQQLKKEVEDLKSQLAALQTS